MKLDSRRLRQEVFKNIYLDHMYSSDDGYLFCKSLERRGFYLEKFEVEHPGKTFCRFISFSKNQYLEFVKVKKGGYVYSKPGLSFGYRNNLKGLFDKLNKKKSISCQFTHKNYDWKKDSVSHLPGWNFVSFKGVCYRTLYTWFTEYESGGKKLQRNYKHANTVYGIYGVELDLTEKSKKFFEDILCKKFINEVSFHDGTHLYIKGNKRNRFNRVILKCKNLEKAKMLVKPDEIIEWNGREALVIKNPSKNPRMWDILIIKA